MTYQWYKNGNSIPGATSSSYTILSVLGSDAGTYYVRVTNAGGTVQSDSAYLNVAPPPGITMQPQSQTIIKGRSVSFSCVATSSLSITYQWYFKGNYISGATNTTYTISQVNNGSGGNYYAVAANSTGGTTSQVATLTVLIPPSIASQPQSTSGVIGQSAGFTVSADGTSPLTYQWCFNGSPIFGATTSSLALSNLNLSQAGNYNVIVTNVAGVKTSAVATLTILIPPSITSQPQSVTNLAGNGAMFTVSAVGSAPLSYQWCMNGIPLPGATATSLTLSNLDPSMQGGYSVIVTNLAGVTNSATASLTVTNLNSVIVTDAVLSAVGTDSNGFSFRVSVPQGYTYVVQASTDLVNWQPIATNTAGTASDVFTDTDAPNYRNRFYRISSP